MKGKEMDSHASFTITNLGTFERDITEKVNHTFMLAFYKEEEMISCFLDGMEKDIHYFLREDVVDFWVDYWTFLNEHEALAIWEYDITRLEKRLYKELVEAVMGELVDDGVLKMCWNAETEEVVWKRTEEV